METSTLRKSMPVSALFDPKIVMPAIGSAFVKLDPRTLIKNPVMFVLEIVTALTTVILIRDLVTGGGHIGFRVSDHSVAVVHRAVRQLRRSRRRRPRQGAGRHAAPPAHRNPGQADHRWRATSRTIGWCPAPSLKVGDLVLVEAGDMIPSDGEVIEGMASVNEAAITGESAPVIRELGGDRSAVTGGTQVLSDWIRVRITAAPGSTFLDRMIRLVEGAERQKTPNEIALNILADRPDHHLRVRDRDDPELRRLCRRHDLGRDPGRAVRDADPDHHRRAAVGHRHRRHGSPGAVQRAGHVRPRRRGRGRRRHAAARQDRHHHARQPPGDRVQAAARRERTGTGRRGAIGVARRRDARGPLHRRAGQGEVRHPRPRARRVAGQLSFRSARRPG